MSAHITQTYLRHALTTAVADALATGSALTQWIAAASGVIDAALSNSGYSSPATANDQIKLATVGVLLEIMPQARKGVEIPGQLREISQALWRGIASGDIQPTGMTPTERDAIGGVAFSDQTTGTTGQAAVHIRLRDVY